MKLVVHFSETNQVLSANVQQEKGSFAPNLGELFVLHDGENGATFIPEVSPDGVISWTNNRDLPNPEPVNIKGAKGDKGEQGERGLQGIQGIQGVQGIQGERGEKGQKGDKGDRGEQGIQGVQGAKGETGAQGEAGTPATHRWSGTTLYITSASGTSYANLKGDKGDQGEKGADGTMTFEDLTEEQKASLVNDVLIILKNTAKAAKIGEVTLLASKWVGSNNLYSQVVSIEGVTEYSQVDITPSVEQLAVFYEKDIAFVTENEEGVVTVYVIGQKPTSDYTIQVTITEVEI